MATPPKSIDGYLKSVSPSHATALQQLRHQILRVVPNAEECISYSMPAFRWRGHVVAGFLATRKGCSFFPFSGTTLDGMAASLVKFSRTKSALHFDPERGLPSSLVRRLVQARQAEIAASTVGNAASKPKKKAAARGKVRQKTGASPRKKAAASRR